jgi:hypothetical protein
MMSNSYAAVSALIFAVVAIVHLVRNRRDRAVQRIHECIVGSPYRCCRARFRLAMLTRSYSATNTRLANHHHLFTNSNTSKTITIMTATASMAFMNCDAPPWLY